MSRHVGDLECLGAVMEPRAIQIQVKNSLDLAKQQGGAAGGIASALVPQTIDTKVLTTMAAQLKQKLREQGVVADVQVVEGPNAKPVSSWTDFTTGAVVGVAGTAGLYFGGRFIVRRILGLFGK